MFDPAFTRRFAAACALVPFVLLLWDAQHGRLGVNGVNYAIRTTGLVGLTFLAATLAVTPLRRLTGWPVLVAARRPLGLAGFAYLALHFVIYVWWDRDRSLSSTFDEIIARRYLWFGFGALLLMLPLAVTSTDAMVARLGARRWKALHRLTYLVVVAGIVHFYLLVKADTRTPRAFAIAVGALLAFRLGAHYLDLRRAARTTRPAAPAPTPRRSWTGELLVARVFDEAPDVRTFRLVTVDGGPLPFVHQPGQYLTLSLPAAAGQPAVVRSYTIASPPTRSGHVEITVKRVRDGRGGSARVHHALREGARVRVTAPAGRFTFTGAGVERVLLLAGGVGITPLMAMTRYLTDRGWPGTIHLVFSVRTPADVIFADELAGLGRRFPNLRLCVVATRAGDDWHGERGHVSAALLRREVPDLAHTQVFLCGPEPMMAAMRALLAGEGVPDHAVHTEAFAAPPPAEPAVLAAPVATAATLAEPVTVRFTRSGKDGEASGDRTLLEIAEDCGVDLPFECRAGACGQCKTRVLSGAVSMADGLAITATERARGLVLACSAHPRGEVTVDA